MPQDFLRCVKEGGRVRTIKPKKGVYLKICYLNGKSYAGEVHHLSQKRAIKRKLKK